jgi:hypothetical protein
MLTLFTTLQRKTKMIQEKKPALKVRLAQFAKEKYPFWINGGELEIFATTHRI